MNELLAGIGHDQISKMDRPERHGSERVAKKSDLRITGMPVLDDSQCVVGSVLMQDIYKAGIVG